MAEGINFLAMSIHKVKNIALNLSLNLCRCILEHQHKTVFETLVMLLLSQLRMSDGKF